MLINQKSIIDEIDNKLFKCGYLKNHPELYVIGFKEREMCNYEINEQFPKVTSRELPSGIGNITYVLDLGICEQFQISEVVVVDESVQVSELVPALV